MVGFTKWGNFITKWVKYLQIEEIKTKQSSTFVTLIYFKWTNDCAYLSWPLIIIYNRE